MNPSSTLQSCDIVSCIEFKRALQHDTTGAILNASDSNTVNINALLDIIRNQFLIGLGDIVMDSSSLSGYYWIFSIH
jgi:hypothetical protein